MKNETYLSLNLRENKVRKIYFIWRVIRAEKNRAGYRGQEFWTKSKETRTKERPTLQKNNQPDRMTKKREAE